VRDLSITLDIFRHLARAQTRGALPRARLFTKFSRCDSRTCLEQCRATRAIKRRFGAKSGRNYLIGAKLPTFVDAAKDHSDFAAELPRFLAAIYDVFNQYEIVGYVAMRKPRARKALQRLLLTDRP